MEVRIGVPFSAQALGFFTTLRVARSEEPPVFPYQAVKSLAPAPFPLSPQNAAPPVLTSSPPVVTILVADPHLKLPRTYEWNVALEHSIGKSQGLSLAYIGAIRRDLLRSTQLFNVNPNFQTVVLTDNSATSDYHALQLKFQRPLSRGLQGLASYTFSHSIDSAPTDAFATFLNTHGAYQTIHLTGD